MPGHFLRRANREFCDPESRTHKVMRQTLHFVKAICSASWAIHIFPHSDLRGCPEPSVKRLNCKLSWHKMCDLNLCFSLLSTNPRALQPRFTRHRESQAAASSQD